MSELTTKEKLAYDLYRIGLGGAATSDRRFSDRAADLIEQLIDEKIAPSVPLYDALVDRSIEVPSAWQPLSTAPKDRQVLLRDDHTDEDVTSCFWDGKV